MKKITIVFIMFCSFVAFASMTTGCKETRIPEAAEIKYSILGEWAIRRVVDNIVGEYYATEFDCTFIGTKESGTITVGGFTGAYSVGGEFGIQLKFSFSYYEDGSKYTEDYTGNMTSNDQMTGTYQIYEGSMPTLTGTWGGERKQ